MEAATVRTTGKRAVGLAGRAPLAVLLAVAVGFGVTSLAVAVAAPQAAAPSEADRAYRRGRELLEKRTYEDVQQALASFERAVANQPDHAPAHAGMADAYALIYQYDKAELAARRAIELDESLAAAHASLGFIRMHGSWDWAGAEQHFRRALELDPGYAAAHYWYAIHHEIMARPDAAVSGARKAVDLEPGSLVYGLGLGYRLFWARRYEEAIEQFRVVLERDPDSGSAHYFLGRCLVELGDFEAAESRFRRAAAISPDNRNVTGALGYLYARSGRRREAARLLETLEADRRPFASYIASIYVALGESDRAIEWLRRAVAGRGVAVAWLRVDARFDPLRQDPRFTALLRELRLIED